MSETDEETAGARLTRKVTDGMIAGGAANAAAGPEGALIGAGVGGLVAGAQEMVGLAVRHLASNGADRRLFEAEDRLKAQDLQDHRQRVDEKLDELKKAVGEKEAASTVLPTLQAWSKAWSGSDGKKRRVIMAALVSAFAPESHDEAMSIRFFEALEHLDYPEIKFACEIYNEFGKDKFGSIAQMDIMPGDRATYMLERLADHGLVRYNSAKFKSVSPTWYGQQFVAFLERGGFLVPSEADDTAATETAT